MQIAMILLKLDPIIRKIQGSKQHIGRLGKVTEHKIDVDTDKKPKASTKQNKQKSEIEELKEKLKLAVKEERYEDAAKLRDEIAKKEK